MNIKNFKNKKKKQKAGKNQSRSKAYVGVDSHISTYGNN